ncbi:MAG: hypothetical protein ACOC43_06040 [Desulfohalobiaceae bacterium]
MFTDLTEIKAQQEQIENQNKTIAKAAQNADQVAQQVTSACEELAAQLQQAEQGTNQQRQRTQETASSMEQINSSITDLIWPDRPRS